MFFKTQKTRSDALKQDACKSCIFMLTVSLESSISVVVGQQLRMFLSFLLSGTHVALLGSGALLAYSFSTAAAWLPGRLSLGVRLAIEVPVKLPPQRLAPPVVPFYPFLGEVPLLENRRPEKSWYPDSNLSGVLEDPEGCHLHRARTPVLPI